MRTMFTTMVTATDLDAIRSRISAEPMLFVYVSTPTCSACDALRPKIERLAGDHDLPSLFVDATIVPGIAGAFSVFTAPSLLLFMDGTEARRWSRFVSIPEVDEALTRIEALARSGP
jgi:thiol-disulfide isomerase/thioredoxin